MQYFMALPHTLIYTLDKHENAQVHVYNYVVCFYSYIHVHTNVDANPPVRLACGHSISKDAMKKLVSHSRR